MLFHTSPPLHTLVPLLGLFPIPICLMNLCSVFRTQAKHSFLWDTFTHDLSTPPNPKVGHTSFLVCSGQEGVTAAARG